MEPKKFYQPLVPLIENSEPLVLFSESSKATYGRKYGIPANLGKLPQNDDPGHYEEFVNILRAPMNQLVDAKIVESPS
jgi:hypothetical protein